MRLPTPQPNELPGPVRVLLALMVLFVPACGLQREPALDQATVIATTTSVRAEPSSSSRTLFRVEEGERVSILEKSGTWYRILDQSDLEGWMDESTLLRDSTLERMREMIEASRAAPVQNTARTLDQVNLRLDPGRDTAIVRRLRRDVPIEVLDRATTPRPDSDATDVWLMVRTGPEEMGWVYRQLVEFDTPPALAPFTEDRTYTSAEILETVADPEAGEVSWYVIGERRAGAPAEAAYDGIRVFTWNLGAHRYETSLRLRDLLGVYPVEIIASDPPGFRFRVLDPDGTVRTREFAMRGTVPREVAPE